MTQLQNSERLHVLLVDDEQNILTLLGATLRSEPYEVTPCNSPEAALAVVARENVDIVLSDFMMPNMDGVEFLRLASRLQPHLVRFLLTATVQLSDAVQAIRDGHVDQLIRKPWGSSALLHTLREAAFEIHARRAREPAASSVATTAGKQEGSRGE